MSVFRRTCRILAIVLFICAVAGYVFVLFNGSDSPQQTLLIACSIVMGFGAIALLSAIGRLDRLILISSALAILGFPLLLLFAYVAEMMENQWMAAPL